MASKINRILIPLFIFLLFSLGSQTPSRAESPISFNYLPLVSNNPTGWIGPYGGEIVVVAFDPTNSKIAYAGTFGSGIFKSTDGGQTWQPSSQGLGNLFINSLSIDPGNPSTLYAGTYRNQLYKSTDGGNSWTWSGSGMQDQAIVYTIAIDPYDPSIIYAGTRGISNNGNPPWNGVLYQSSDAGQTWNPVQTNLGGSDVQDWAYSITVNPANHNVVYEATHQHGPLESNNYGNVWFETINGISDLSGRSIVISPEFINGMPVLYYGVWHDDTIYKSINGAGSWFLSDQGIPALKVYSISIDNTNSNTLYLATFNDGVIKSIDAAVTWNTSGLQDDSIYSVAIDPISSTNLLAGTSGDGLFRSTDGGSSWFPSNMGINNAMVTSTVISPTHTDTVYASLFGAGVDRSDNQGKNWSIFNSGLPDKYVHQVVMDPALPGLLYALTDTHGLYQINLKSGGPWISVGQGLPLTTVTKPPYPMDHPFATREMIESEINSQQIMTSTLATPVSLLNMIFTPSNPQVVYMGTGGDGVYKSTDAGTSWLSSGLAGDTINSLAVDYTNPNLVYAATDITGSLKISPDGGASWTDALLPVTFYSLAASLKQSGVVYAGTSSGVYHYQNSTWTKLGLSGLTVTVITVNPSQPDLIYVGTSSGAYYSKDSGNTWLFVNQYLLNQTVEYISIDPLIPNLVYFDTKTHGIFMSIIHY